MYHGCNACESRVVFVKLQNISACVAPLNNTALECDYSDHRDVFIGESVFRDCCGFVSYQQGSLSRHRMLMLTNHR